MLLLHTWRLPAEGKSVVLENQVYMYELEVHNAEHIHVVAPILGLLMICDISLYCYETWFFIFFIHLFIE